VSFASVEDVERALSEESYLPDRGLATAVFLALAMRRPLLLEGEAGVGKTEVGKTLARILRAELIPLQCYEGIDASQALYEWDYARQLLYARALQVGRYCERPRLGSQPDAASGRQGDDRELHQGGICRQRSGRS
jgi:MoxR-like ATPase